MCPKLYCKRRQYRPVRHIPNGYPTNSSQMECSSFSFFTAPHWTVEHWNRERGYLAGRQACSYSRFYCGRRAHWAHRMKLSPKISDFLFPLAQEQVFHLDSRTESGKGRCSFNPQVNTASVMISRCFLPPPFRACVFLLFFR